MYVGSPEEKVKVMRDQQAGAGGIGLSLITIYNNGSLYSKAQPASHYSKLSYMRVHGQICDGIHGLAWEVCPERIKYLKYVRMLLMQCMEDIEISTYYPLHLLTLALRYRLWA
jgi:hypothetical protein